MRIYIVALACALVACDRPAVAPAGKVAAPAAAASGPWDNYPSVDERLSKLERKVLILEGQQQIRSVEGLTAEFDPQEPKRYQTVRTGFGQALLLLENVEPYLDGFAATFRLGNTTSATLNGIKGKVQWGPPFDAKDTKTWDMQVKDFEDVTQFQPGTWTPFVVKFGPATAAQARRIALSPEFSSLALRSVPNVNAR